MVIGSTGTGVTGVGLITSATGGATTGGGADAVLPPPHPASTNKLTLQILRKTIPNLPLVEALPDQCEEKLPVAARF
jgi:hypothetical protein